MEAKDTVMNFKQMNLLRSTPAVAEAQAEITFPLGKKEGMQEVVKGRPTYYISMEAHKKGDIDDLIMWGWEQSANAEGEVCLMAIPKAFLKERGLGE